MSSTRGTRLTYAGLNALAKCQQDKELHFTRVVMGDGTISEDQDIRQLSGLVSPRLVLPIKSIKITGTGTTVLETELKNTNLEKGFMAREVGIFIIDPDTLTKTESGGKTTYNGTEILYAVRNTGNDSDYVPAGGGSDVWNILYDVVTVIDQAENVTANINGDVAYVTRVDFNDHESAVSPHPNFMRAGNEVNTAAYINCDYTAPGDKINYISADHLKTQILGDMSDMPTLQARVRQLERENANLALKMEAENKMPDCNMLLAENFKEPDSIDTLSIKVTSCAAGDDSIDLERLYGVITGSWYWIADGVNDEFIQVKSCIKNGSVYRIITAQKLLNTYDLANTYIYRTTADISMGEALGAGDKRGFVYSPSFQWAGAMANTSKDILFQMTQDKADTFDVDCTGGSIVFGADGLASIA